ncbi:ATP binding [Rhodotorula toruloides]
MATLGPSLLSHHPHHHAASPANSPSSPSFPHQALGAGSAGAAGRGVESALGRTGAGGTASPDPTLTGAVSTPSSSGSAGLDYASLASWDDSHVSLWLSTTLPPSISHTYAPLFASNDIRGNVLLEVDQQALKEMGVRSVGDRVKICVAVKGLRGRVAAATRAGGVGRRPSVLARSSATRPTSPLVPSSTLSSPMLVQPSPPSTATAGHAHSAPSTATSPAPPSSFSSATSPARRPGSASLSYSARSISVGNRIPPPLHLAQSNTVTTGTRLAVQRSPPSTGSSSATTTSTAPRTIATSPRSATFLPPTSLNQARGVGSSSSGSATTRGTIPPSPTTLTSSASTSSLSLGSRGPATYGHRKASSSAGVGGVGGRPQVHPVQQPVQDVPAASSYAGHPYAASGSGSGTGPTLLPSAIPLPSRSATTPALPTTTHPSAPLSNLEMMRKAVKFTSADGVTTRVLAVADAKDGREVLGRVMRKFGAREGEDVEGWGVWTTEVSGAGAFAFVSSSAFVFAGGEEEKLIYFAGTGRTARLLTEHELYQICQNASAPERTRGLIVRRHHTLPPASSTSITLSTSPPTGTFPSTPSSPSQPSFSTFSPSQSAALANKRGRKLQWVFGESHAVTADSSRPGGTAAFPSSRGASPTSPNYLGIEIPRMGIEPASGDEYDAYEEDDDEAEVLVIADGTGAGKADARGKTKLNRASTVSVMSGLEAPDWARDYYGAGERGLDPASSPEKERDAYPLRRGGQEKSPYSPPQRTSSRRIPPPTFVPSDAVSVAAQVARPAREVPPPAVRPTSTINPNEGRSSLLPDSTRKLRNFFGQRPPSELITTHLTEYFPLGLRGGQGDKSERRLLSKQVRASIRKSMSAAAGGVLVPGSGGIGRRYSNASLASRVSRTRSRLQPHGSSPPPAVPGETSWEREKDAPIKELAEEVATPTTATSRFSGSSNGSNGSPASEVHITSSSLPAGLAASSSASVRTGGRSPRSSSGSMLDPPDEAAEDAGLSQSPGSTSMLALNSSASSTSTSTSATDQADTRSLASSLAAPTIGSRRLSRRMSRMSASSRLSVGAQSLWERRSKDSDAASIITVDEVTAELETRRASGVSWRKAGQAGDSDSDASDDEASDFDAGLSDEGDLSDEVEDDETSEEEDEPGTAKPESKGMKWIKGALIGAGSFGSVYLGMNPMTGSLMAVKQVELPTGKTHNEERKKGMLEALEREIELLKDLQHENIVQYLDSSMDGQHLNIFLEYVPGGSVAALLQNYGAFEEALVSKFVRQILTGLDYLHEREIIHRDIKGANILVDNKGNIKISDFGISKKVEDTLLTGAKVHRPSLQGSVYWMAPEVVKQTAYTSKADIWSLGCLVVEMLTGAHPWANLTQMQAIFRIGSSVRPTVPDDISSEADDFLEQTFEIEHTDRPSAKELLQHGFIRDPDALAASQQTPTRATFSQNGSDNGSSSGGS